MSLFDSLVFSHLLISLVSVFVSVDLNYLCLCFYVCINSFFVCEEGEAAKTVANI